MASFEPIDYDPNAPPPRPDTPPVRRGFVMVLLVLLIAAAAVYGIPYVAERTGYRYEVGRARAAAEALRQLDDDEVLNRASALFRLASVKVQPAVVSVRTSRMTPARPGGGGPAPTELPLGSGSGVVIDKDKGYIVTNHHVIADADAVSVRLGRREMSARVVGSDQKTDLAVLQVAGGGLRAAAEWGDPESVDIGDWVLAIGSPYQLDRTVTAGIISATGRGNLPLPIFATDFYQDFVQTDAAINPGNSGGPLINLSGEVIGINTAILSETGGYQGIGLAISARLAERIVAQLIQDGRVIRGYLGVSIRDLFPQDLEGTGLSEPTGAWIEQVVPDGPADRAGLEVGDIVLSIDGQAVRDSNALRTRTITLPIERPVPLTILRDGRRRELEVTIGAMPILLDLGLFVSQGPPDGLPMGMLRGMSGTPEDDLFIVGVQPGSPAARAGLQPGLRIVAVGEPGVPVETVDALDELAAARFDPEGGLVLRTIAPEGDRFDFRIGANSAD